MPQNRKSVSAFSLVIVILSVSILFPSAYAANKPSETNDRSGRTIFRRSSPLTPPRTIKVDKVVVVQETGYSVILDIHYTYQNEIPTKEIKVFVLPDMAFWMTNPMIVEKGSHVGRVSIDLNEKKMKEDQVEQYETSKLTVSFDHYAPDRFNGAIYKEIIPFKKVWRGRK